MTERTPVVLLVEDMPSLASVYKEYLRREPVEVQTVTTGRDALTQIRERLPAVVLLDLNLPDMSGMDILKEAAAAKIPSTFIVITAHGSINTAVEAMRNGAVDFLVKPFTAERLATTLRNSLERRKLVEIVESYRETYDRNGLVGLIGTSLAMQRVYRIIESAAPSNATIFITGESGTGKELCAQAVHRLSPRRDKPFHALNCAAIAKDLIESEIFGHVRGAFTGATGDRDGAAARANGGTLFLDEICEMDIGLQSKLLRFIQTGTFQRVGGNREEQANIRFLCATNRDPLREVQEGRFREDLYYRLYVVPIHLPPLREREEDVLLLARSFLDRFATEERKRFKRFSPEVEALLLSYSWPGNVRQLENTIRNVIVLNDGESVLREMLPPPLGEQESMAAMSPNLGSTAPAAGSVGNPQPSDLPSGSVRPLWRVEKEAIEQAIAICAGNIPRAAALLEISASTIYRKKQQWDAPD